MRARLLELAEMPEEEEDESDFSANIGDHGEDGEPERTVKAVNKRFAFESFEIAKRKAAIKAKASGADREDPLRAEDADAHGHENLFGWARRKKAAGVLRAPRAGDKGAGKGWDADRWFPVPLPFEWRGSYKRTGKEQSAPKHYLNFTSECRSLEVV